MALQKDMELEQIKAFLEGEVKEQIALEISPLLYNDQATGGYFGVTRQILCMVDFLGALFCGYTGKKKFGRMEISESWKATQFITTVFGEFDDIYRQNGEVLYYMYRHGLVHLYQPKVIRQQSGRVLKWAIYKGQRETHSEEFDTQEGTFTIPNARHLSIVVDPRDTNSDLLTISINCLHQDLLTSIDNFLGKLQANENNTLNKWRETANAILEIEEYPPVSEKNQRKFLPTF